MKGKYFEKSLRTRFERICDERNSFSSETVENATESAFFLRFETEVLGLLDDLVLFDWENRLQALGMLKDMYAAFLGLFSKEKMFPADDIFSIGHKLLMLFSLEELGDITREWNESIKECFSKGIRFGTEYEFQEDAFDPEKGRLSESLLVDLFAPVSMNDFVHPLPFSDKDAAMNISPRMLEKILSWLEEHPDSEAHPGAEGEADSNRTDLKRMRLNIVRTLEEVDIHGKIFGLEMPTLCDLRLVASACACGIHTKEDAAIRASRVESWLKWLSTLSVMLDTPGVANPNLAAFLFWELSRSGAPTYFANFESDFRRGDSSGVFIDYKIAAGKAYAHLTGGARIIVSAHTAPPSTPWAKNAYLLAGEKPKDASFWFPEFDTLDVKLKTVVPGIIPDGEETESPLKNYAYQLIMESNDETVEDFLREMAGYAALLSEHFFGLYDVTRFDCARSAWCANGFEYLEVATESPLNTAFLDELNARASNNEFWNAFGNSFTAEFMARFSVFDIARDIFFFAENKTFSPRFQLSEDVLDRFAAMVEKVVNEESDEFFYRLKIPCIPGVFTRNPGENILGRLVDRISEANGKVGFANAVSAAALLRDDDVALFLKDSENGGIAVRLAGVCVDEILSAYDDKESDVWKDMGPRDVLEEDTVAKRLGAAASIVLGAFEKNPWMFEGVSPEKMERLRRNGLGGFAYTDDEFVHGGTVVEI